ncbi:hypothetical protein CGRA01v4_10264 [Colletotrichum graminicola]|nr:hypothetical protein CGRA01v4_10264 [Colletotrichum graminicola]
MRARVRQVVCRLNLCTSHAVSLPCLPT